MNKFLNLKNGRITINTYRLADAELCEREELLAAYEASSDEVLTADATADDNY